MNRRDSLWNRIVRRLQAIRRWMYRGGRPNAFARVLNRVSEAQFTAGFLVPAAAMTLEVTGRRSGLPVRLPIVVADVGGERYLVSMLGPDAGWVRNVRAAGGRAVLHRRGSEEVILEEVDPGERAPILRRYLEIAPGGRAHFPVDRRADLAEFAAIADRYPVFRIRSADAPGAGRAPD